MSQSAFFLWAPGFSLCCTGDTAGKGSGGETEGRGREEERRKVGQRTWLSGLRVSTGEGTLYVD